MGFPMNNNSLLALPYEGVYSIPKKKLAAMVNSKKSMGFHSEFLSATEVDKQMNKEDTAEISESGYTVDGLNFCKSFPLKVVFFIFPTNIFYLLNNHISVVSPADGNPSSPGMATHLDPEPWKTLLSVSYFVVVTIITSLAMVTVHDRVPDMKKYPPLPDIFLDNVPLIPWVSFDCLNPSYQIC